MKRVSGGDMEKGVYDTNGNAVVDYSEGVRDVSDFPVAPKVGEVVVKSGRVYVYITE